MTTADSAARTFKNFTLEIDADKVATVWLDVPGQKVNTLSPAVGEELDEIIDQIDGNPAVVAVVLASGKAEGFIAGAEITAIRDAKTAAQATALAQRGQRSMAKIEALHRRQKKPVVAALHGPTLGGGLEVALACSMRLASDAPQTRLGLPEVQLGLLPGAGGTQRLPRLIGVANALDLILSGRALRARSAKKMGLVDEVVPAAQLVPMARRRAREAAAALHAAPGNLGEAVKPGRKDRQPTMAHGLGIARVLQVAQAAPQFLQQVALEENPLGLKLLFSKAREQLLQKTHGNYPAPERALEVIRLGLQEGLEAGYAAEADRFGLLAMTPHSRSLVSLFFATQQLKKDSGVADAAAQPLPVRKVGVLGGGLMGSGIASITLLQAGLPVRLKDVDDAGLCRARAHVQKILGKEVTRRRRSAHAAGRLLNQMTCSLNYQGFANAQVIIEAAYEDLPLKQRLLQEVEAHCPADTIFASNTSAIPIAQIAAGAQHPERVIGMHYFSPAEKMPLLEVVVAPQTADWVVATCVALGQAQKKTVIVVRDGPGFYTTRVMAAYLNEAAWMLCEGASIEAVDAAMVEFGFPVGPVTLFDEIGLDVGAKVDILMHAAFGKRFAPPAQLQTLQQDGRLGRKNGRGFYTYRDGKRGAADASVYALMGQGRQRQSLAPYEIYERLACALVNEAARCLQENILRSARDGDIGAVFGLGFPPFLGGPFTYVDRQGAKTVVKSLQRLAQQHGERFEPAQLLCDHAASGELLRGSL
jgi:3-hydroxyacyl-CoA dehydrogenase/enoyl-CoA hydratase/3-hydroxybutyryl-CoA epimerase